MSFLPSQVDMGAILIDFQVLKQTLHQFSSVTQSCPTLCNPMNHSMPGLPVHHQILEFTQSHVHRVGDAIQPSHPLLSLSLPALNFTSIRVFSNQSDLHIRWPKYWSFQLQHQSFRWKSLEGLIGRFCIPRINSTWSQCICISFSTLLDLVCQYFVEDFCVWDHEIYQYVASFFEKLYLCAFHIRVTLAS